MIRTVIGFLGILAVLIPDGMIDIFERIAVENPSQSATRPWISSGIRLEGVVVTVACLTGGRAYTWMMNLTGAFGAVILLVPHLYRRLATALLYEDPDSVEWNDQFTDIVRLIGVVYILMAVWEYRNRRTDN